MLRCLDLVEPWHSRESDPVLDVPIQFLIGANCVIGVDLPAWSHTF